MSNKTKLTQRIKQLVSNHLAKCSIYSDQWNQINHSWTRYCCVCYVIGGQIANLLGKPWFFGDIPKEKAEMILGPYKGGTFLVRFGPSIPLSQKELALAGAMTIRVGTFFISSRDKKTKSINHYEIICQRQSSKELFLYKERSFETLDLLIHMLKKELYLNEPCPGSQYAKI